MNINKILQFIRKNIIQISVSLVFIICCIVIIQPLFKSTFVKVSLDDVTVRAKPNRNSNKLGTVSQNENVEVLSKVKHWDKVRYNDDQIGWIPEWLTNQKFPRGQKATKLSETTIVLDPGHGGNDSGALAINPKYEEKTYTLRTALAVQKRLAATGARVIMTRSDDTFVDLAPRAQLSNDVKADAFISFHFDSSAQNNVGTGDTTYYYHKNTSLSFAKTINSELITTLPLYNRGYNFANYQVLRDNKRPAILIEGGYINSKNDFKKISSASYPNKMATAVTHGLEKYFN